MIKWLRQSGTTIELADTENLIEFAEAQGWTRDKPEEVKEVEVKPKRTRRNKAQMAAHREALANGNNGTSH